MYHGINENNALMSVVFFQYSFTILQHASITRFWWNSRRHVYMPNTTRSSATAKSTARPSCLVGVLYDISPQKICWWLINHFYVTGHESYRIPWNKAK